LHHARTPWPAETRVRYVVTFDELRKQHPRLSARQFCTMIEVPYSTFARWLARFRAHGPRGLLDRSRRPRRHPSALPGAVLDIVRGAHRRSGLGVRLLHHVLTAAGRITCSVSSVYRILRRAGALVRRPRRPKPVWVRYQRAVPGERAQMDLKYLPQERFQLTLVDDCSRMVAATVLTRRTSAAVCEALPALLDRLPFPMRCIQTDNGPEFGLALTHLLDGRGIRHVRIRPHTPRLNGKVERVQRTIAEELWDHVAPGSLAAWQRRLESYLRFYNMRRPHSALGYQTPLAYARSRLPAVPGVSHMS
jgi:transposase InsO family protein